MRHVLRLPQQAPWTGQPGRTTGLERLGFYGDTWAALRAGLWAALRAGLRAALRTGPPGHATRRAAGPCYESGRLAALRVGPPGRATSRAADRAARRTNYSATVPLDLRTNGRTTPIHTNGHRGSVPLAQWSLQPDLCTVRWDYARGSDSVCWSLLHTAGQDNSGRVIRLHLLGPAAILGSGRKPGREEQRGSTRGGTGGRRRLRRAEPGRAGP